MRRSKGGRGRRSLMGRKQGRGRREERRGRGGVRCGERVSMVVCMDGGCDSVCGYLLVFVAVGGASVVGMMGSVGVVGSAVPHL